jgi:hypothetical protein
MKTVFKQNKKLQLQRYYSDEAHTLTPKDNVHLLGKEKQKTVIS